MGYSKSSPYYNTPMFGNFLDVANFRSIPPYGDDVKYVIDYVYKWRPDMLAYDLYGDAGLWWVFAMRNPNALKDPLFDFLPGVTISLPKKTTLTKILGL